jgi:hypothetical protein|tara:strand:+ start:1172 stop:1420 length:249 start_codon:yes stop_codon:yes gene_type:complete
MTQDTDDFIETPEEEMHQLGYGLKLSKLTDAQHHAATERRAVSIEAHEARKANNKEALRKLIYDTPPDDTPYMSELLRSKGK